jgi:HTH-type transcriptional regulator/antitoxin HigA
MNKGEANLSEAEKKQVRTLALAAEYYEDNVLKIMPLPITIQP